MNESKKKDLIGGEFNEELKRKLQLLKEFEAKQKVDSERLKEALNTVDQVSSNHLKKQELNSRLKTLEGFRDRQMLTRKTFIEMAMLRGEEPNVGDLDKEIEKANREINDIRKKLAELDL